MSAKSRDRFRGPVRQVTMMDIVRQHTAVVGNRSASISTGLPATNNSAIKKFLQRRTATNLNLHSTQHSRGDYWKKLQEESKAKKLKMVKYVCI